MLSLEQNMSRDAQAIAQAAFLNGDISEMKLPGMGVTTIASMAPVRSSFPCIGSMIVGCNTLPGSTNTSCCLCTD